ncbi:MAG: WYL domain-containing protein, partial [Candidatus Calescibacterium sp.]|nr:WYL domain-containing protein [Candidatus Calescibacterium sp.]
MSISKSKRSNNDDKERQNNLQRTLELIEYFSSVKKIINDKEGNKLRELKKIYGQDKKKKKTILKQFKRDRDFLQELGIDVNLNLSKKIKSEDLVLNEGEKKKIAKGILYQIQNTNNKAYRDKLISLYYKLFFSELRFIKKLLKIIKNYNESDLNQLRLLTKSNHNNHNTTPLIELFRLISRKKPIKIIYRKKNGDIISRVIYPLIIYKNLRIFYLISWDYEKSEIRNFIYSNILSYEAISNPSYLKVEIVGDPNEPNPSNKILVPIREIYRNLPHPFFISNEKNPMRIKITIKSYYKDL